MGVKKILVSWSSGKDSAWTLHALRADPSCRVVGLLTTVNVRHERVAMHSVRRSILEAQARSVGLDLQIVPLPWPCANEVYESAMSEAIRSAVSRGITHVAFGDLFLREIRAYREQQLASTPLRPLFPLWDLPTHSLARAMIDGGIRAVVTCVDPRQLPPAFAGRPFDPSFLDDLPPEVDPCGENGEFHTCVLDGPDFCRPIPARVGTIVERDGFVFADVVPETEENESCASK